ncbi:hypothetical protein NVP1079O_05 [Vibrio phage 1.079.O._10N.286.45.E9]|nr:hypothetical protein NVP1079O_05 [Vibrio phage 1.079.O._10N.286.45.E9]
MTYDSYEEAKIANPESEIVTTGPNWKYPAELKGKFERLVAEGVERHVLEDSAWVKCNPADYAMSVMEKKVRVEYVKVEFVSDKEKAEAFIDGGLRFFTHGPVRGDLEHDTIPVTRLDELLCGNAIYRRIETPTEWWEDASEFIKPLGHSEVVSGQLLVEAAMTRKQWCEFARILLEQGG